MKLKLTVAVALLAAVLYGLSGTVNSLEKWTHERPVAEGSR
jgi:hypothetical protein